MSVDEVYKKVRHYVHSVDVLVGVHVVKRHAIVDVQCVLVIRVVIGVNIVVLSDPLCCSLCRPNSHTVVVHPTLLP